MQPSTSSTRNEIPLSLSSGEIKSNSRWRHFSVVIPILNCLVTPETICQDKNVTFCTGQQEEGESSFRHWQLIVCLKNATTLNAYKKRIGLDSVRVATDLEGMIQYSTDLLKRVSGTELFTYGEVSLIFFYKRDCNPLLSATSKNAERLRIH